MLRLTSSLLVVALSLSSPLQSASASPIHGAPFYHAASQNSTPIFSVTGTHGAVATEVDVCSNIGALTLERGGSAADAVIAASLCVGSIAAFHSGIGGGGFGIVRDVRSPRHVDMIDFRETMPAAGYERMFVDNPDKNASLIGGLAVGVPGELKAWKALHDRYGKLPWKQLFEPAIELNTRGFLVTDQLSKALDPKAYPFLCADPVWKEAYCPDGVVKRKGERVRRTRYAHALKRIAHHGIDDFYSGTLAQGVVDAVQARKGILTLDDLEGYEAIWRKTNNVTFADGRYRAYSGVAPCSGNAVLSTLQTMDQYGTSLEPGVNLTTHRIIEATKFAYGERTTFGDPAFVHNVTRLQHEYLRPDYAREKRDKILDTSVLANVTDYDPSRSAILADSGTSQLTVVDKHGLTVTLTTTINTFWGSQVMTEHGVILNNEMDDFSSPGSANFFGLAPTAANFIRPGKRPLSSISPLIVIEEDTGRLILATGSAGGSRIITAVIQLAFDVLHYGLDLQASIRKPRWHHQLSPNVASFEYDDPTIPNFDGFDNSTVAFLASLGHNVSYVAPGSSTPQGVQLFGNGTLLAATEVRQLSARGAAF
ncbi:uncharacterized protein PFL1_00040 [Pseudozyma flocculosa PF-1]|uniref:Glutathione hydrolase n=1 Tax=Pseudozyma flocculosa TaxID=84751 RepID=A0A5C3EVY5_9BASI|nr:uncharacterized protein PFL1_00040 [Pseudozyma flocculosa PF-1]EPQ31841.1 hypothetical protein PFL1_00040 [Pseudozyma flocculosa PF-1]SPO35261.1 related to gamma-glutamyltransferase [Pseudozyma flocculosa]